MKGKRLTALLLGISLFLFASHLAAEEVLFSDDFDSYSIKNWGPMPTAAITVENGILRDSPQAGQIFLASLKKFKYVTLEMKVKFNRFSTDSTIFYYLGFQSLTPWCYNVCWITIQDAALFASVVKDGDTAKSVREHVYDLVPNRWYLIKIVWSESQIQFFIDGERIYRITSPDAIPEASMPIFLSANTLGSQPADMEIDWVTIKGERKE